MEWMDYDEVINYEYEEGESHYGGEAEGEYCARNLEDAIFRDIIEFASSSCIMIGSDGKIGTVFFSEEQVRDSLRDYLKIYEGLLWILSRICQKRFCALFGLERFKYFDL